MSASVDSVSHEVNLVVIYNPFDPSDCARDKLVWGEDRTVAEYLEGLPDEIDWVISINGEVINPERFGERTMAPEDYLVISPIPQGGGDDGGKSVMRMVAMLAIAAFAAWAAPALVGVMGITAGSTAASVATAVIGGVITTAGGMLVNALMPAQTSPVIEDPSDSWGDTDSATYGVDGAKNSSSENVPVSIVYGEHRVGGNRIHTITENDGDVQYLRAQFLLSEGPIESVSDIEINGEALENYDDIEVVTRLGTDDQEIVGWFDDSVTLNNVGTILDDSWLTETTDQEVDKIRVDLTAPSGLVKVSSSDGSYNTVTVPVRVEFRKVGDEDWQLLGSYRWIGWDAAAGASNDDATSIKVSVKASTTTVVREETGRDEDSNVVILTPASGTYRVNAEYRKVGDTEWITLGDEGGTWESNSTIVKTYTVADLPAGAYEVRVNTGSIHSAQQYSTAELQISGSTRSAIRRSVTSEVLPQGKYEVRVKRTTTPSESDYVTDDIYLTDVGEIVVDDVRYNHSAFLAVNILLSDQISQIPTVTALVKGRVINTYDIYGNVVSTVWSSNPAWITIDILTHSRYGGRAVISRLDMPKFVEWAEWCDEKGLTFDGVFDFHSNIWEAAKYVTRCGHAQLVPVGTRYSVAIDKPDVPEMMYGMGNIIEGSMSIEWLPQEDRANEIEITYFDKDDGYAKRTLRVTDFVALARGVEPKTASFTMLGVTDTTRANEEAWFALAKNRYLLRSVSFEAPLEAIASTIGGVALVQHDIPKWGNAGRLELGCTDTLLKLDQPVTMESGKSYKALVHQSAVKRWDAVVEVMLTGSVFVSGITDATARLNRCIYPNTGQDVEIEKVIDGDPYVEILLKSVPSGLMTGDTIELWDTDVIEERNVILDVGEVTEVTVDTPYSHAPDQYANFMFGEVNKVKKPFRVLSVAESSEYTRTLGMIEYNESIYDDPETAVGTPNYSNFDMTITHVQNVSIDEELYYRRGIVTTRLIIDWDFPETGIYAGAEIFFSKNAGVFQSVGSVSGGARSFTIDVDDGNLLGIKVIPYDGAGARPLFNTADVYYHEVVGKTAKPLAVQDFTVNKTVAGVQFKWTLNSEIDIAGYEIREGATWDSGVAILSNFAGNSWTTEKTISGSYTYHICAIDTTGNYSEVPSTVVLTLPAPADVTGFHAVQNNNLIIFGWDANNEADLGGYELREGSSWGAGRLIGKVTATSYTLTADVAGDLVYWIKAYDTSRVYSDNAVYASPKVAPYQSRNVIHEQDEFALSFPSCRIFMSERESGTNIILEDGYQKGEYLHTVDLGGSVFARSVIEDGFDAVVSDPPAWQDMGSSDWTSVEAQSSWTKSGQLESVSLARGISKYVGLGASDVEAFNGSLTGVNGTAPNTAEAVFYRDGRFTNGIHTTGVTTVEWSVATPSEFKMTYWIRPQLEGEDFDLMRLTGVAGRELALRFDSVSGDMLLEGSDGNDVAVTPPAFVINDPLFIAIVQTATERKLFVGDYKGENINSAVLAAAPIGAFDTLHGR